MASPQKIKLINNSRFYILVSSILLSALVASYLRLTITSDQLFYIRTEQLFGFIAIGYWYLALIISPIGFIIGKQRVRHLEFARRAIGVSAAYFAVLHVCVATWGQLGGLSEIVLLPSFFKWSIAGGAVALVILLVMAVTSFDKVVSFMTYRKWKWLHRLVYISLVLAILHIWTLGTHLAYPNVQWIAFGALVILSGLELYKTIILLNKNHFHLDKTETITLFVAVWVMVVVLIASVPTFINNYHTKHAEHSHNEAHVLITDNTKSKGAVLHIMPDDDPIAGQESTLFFDIQTSTLKNAHLTIKNTATGKVVEVPTELSGSSVTANYVFPAQGVYAISLTATSAIPYTFNYSQRVERGVIVDTLNKHSHPFAQFSLIFSTTGFMFLFVIMFNRRKEILEQSTF